MVLRANSSQQTAGVERRQGALKKGKLMLGTTPQKVAGTTHHQHWLMDAPGAEGLKARQIKFWSIHCCPPSWTPSWTPAVPSIHPAFARWCVQTAHATAPLATVLCLPCSQWSFRSHEQGFRVGVTWPSAVPRICEDRVCIQWAMCRICESYLCLRSLDWLYFWKIELLSSVWCARNLRQTSQEVLTQGPAEPLPACARS